MPKVDVEMVRPFLEEKLRKLEAEAAQLRKLLGRSGPSSAPAAKRRGMTPAQKADVSKRMKAYWAARRAKKAR